MENPTQLYNVNKSLTNICGQSTVNFSGGTIVNFSGSTPLVNASGTIGLNVYQIYPKKLIYPLSAYNSAPTSGTNAFIGIIAQSYSVSSFNIGQNVLKNFNIYNISATDTRALSVDIDYINASGNAARSTVSISNNSGTQILQNAININRLSWTPLITVFNPVTVYARVDSGTIVLNSLTSDPSSSISFGSAVITVPNSYIGVISELYIYAFANDNIRMFVKDKNNNIKSSRFMHSAIMVSNRTNYLGELNYPLYPGDSVYFGSELNTAGDRYVKAIVTLTAY